MIREVYDGKWVDGTFVKWKSFPNKIWQPEIVTANPERVYIGSKPVP